MSSEVLGLDDRASIGTPRRSAPPRPAPVTLVIAVAVAIIAIRLCGPSDLMDNEQQLQSAYVMDVRINHHWLCQKDETGDIASKPPLYTWLAVLANLPLSKPSDLAMRLPSALATLGAALLVFHLARRLGQLPAFLAALAYLLSYATVRSAGLARMDGIVAPASMLCAAAALRAWETRRGWIWFWLACAMATLTKSPVVALVGSAGLLAALRGRRHHPRPGDAPIWPGHLIGLGLFLMVTVGWLVLAIKIMGRPVYDKLIVEELWGKAFAVNAHTFPLIHFYQPPFMFLTRFAPWSVLTLIALGRIFGPLLIGLWRRPRNVGIGPVLEATPAFDLFVGCWFVGGMIPFCIASHQRGDLLLPLFPPAAILAGQELARWVAVWRPALRATALAGAVLLALGLAAFKYDIQAASTDPVIKGASVARLARWIDAQGGADLPVTHVDTPYALQFDRNTMQPLVSARLAAELLKGHDAAFVAVCDLAPLWAELGDAPVYVLRTAALHTHKMCVISNRPSLIADDRMAVGAGELIVRTQGLRWISAGESEFRFEGHGQAAIINRSSTDRQVTLRAGGTPHAYSVPAGAERRVEVP